MLPVSTLSVLVTLVQVAAAAVYAQQRPEFRARVDLVQLQVQVRDRAGEFITGLGAEDFVIVVDGEVRPAQSAYEVDLRTVPRAGSDDTSSGNAATLQPADDLPPAARRHFLLLFDFSFTTRSGVREARESALQFIDQQIRVGDLVGVATIDRHGMDLSVPFTRNRAYAREVTADLDLDRATDIETFDPAEFAAYVTSVSNYVGYLQQLGKMLQAIDGRKHLVLLSTGFADSLLEGMDLDTRAAFSEARLTGIVPESYMDPAYEGGSPEVRAAIAAAVQELLEADGVIHALDPRGLLAPGGDPSEMAPGRSRGPRAGGDGREALYYLASGTGGQAHWNLNDLTPAFAQVEEATAQYYVVAYRKQPTDPSTVSIEVEVQHPDMEVVSAPRRLTTPADYQDMSEAQQQLRLAEAMTHDTDVVAMTLDSKAVSFPAPSDSTPYVAVLLQVAGRDLDRVAVQRGDDKVQLEIACLALGPDQTVLDYARRRIGIDVARMRATGPMEAQSFRHTEFVDVPVGEGRVRILVRDSQVGDLTATTRHYDAATLPQSLFLAQPIVVDAYRLPPIRGDSERFNPLLLKGQRLVPSPVPSVVLGGGIEVLAVLYNASPDATPGQLLTATTVQLQDAGGSVHVLPNLQLKTFQVTEGSNAVQLLLGASVPWYTRPGQAQLTVRVTDRLGGQEIHGSTQLVVTAR